MLKVGDILYCKKDFTCKRYNGFKCKKGDPVEIINLELHKFHVDDSSVVIAYNLKNIDGISSYLLIRRVPETISTVSYVWNYFVTKKGKAKNIRKKAKQFLEC